MSVINNVLRDLEKRESGFTPIDIAPLAASAAPRARGMHLPWILPLLILGLAGGWFYLQQSPPAFEAAALPPSALDAPAPAVTVAPPPGPEEEPGTRDLIPRPAPPAAVIAAPPPGTPRADAAPAVSTAATSTPAGAASETGNQIIGLQLRETVDEMRMEFLLRERAVAYLKERGHNHFSYHLRAVDSQIAAPRMRDQRWVRALEINTAGSGVDIEFTTAPEILVETRQGLLDGEPVWSISLRRAPPAHASIPAAEGFAADAREPAPGAAVANTGAGSANGLASLEAGSAPPTGAAAETRPRAQIQAPPAVEPEPVRLEIKAASTGSEAVDRLEHALELIRERRVTEAEALLRQLLGGSEDYQARRRLLALYQRERQARRFRQLLAESLRRYPGDAPLQTEYARLLVSGGAYREAIELLASQPRLDANQLSLVAASYQRLGRHLDAVRHYRLALAQDAANARNWIALGISLEQGAAHADALQSYQRAAALGGLEADLQAFVEQRSAALNRALD